MSRLKQFGWALGVVVLAGCAMSPQKEPVAIDVPVPTEASPASPSTEGRQTLAVYLVRGEHLAPAERPASGRTAMEAVAALDAGPSADESRAGLRSAIAAGSISSAVEDGDVVVVDVTNQFVETSGTDQLLAVAQVVWTVTELSPAAKVRLTRGNAPLEVPTDRGLSSMPVGRDDYASVAPERGAR